MIELTRLNSHRLIVNCDLIKFVENTPDTTITLINGEKLIVLEPADELLTQVALWRSRILQLAWPDAATALAATASCTPNHFPPLDQQ
jgi:flagellar protein FlbD